MASEGGGREGEGGGGDRYPVIENVRYVALRQNVSGRLSRRHFGPINGKLAANNGTAT